MSPQHRPYPTKSSLAGFVGVTAAAVILTTVSLNLWPSSDAAHSSLERTADDRGNSPRNETTTSAPVIQSKNQTTSTTSSRTSNLTGLMSESALVTCFANDSPSRRIAESLAKQLTMTWNIPVSVALLGAERGDDAVPDTLILVETLHKTLNPEDNAVATHVTINMGTGLRNSRHGYLSTKTPPIVDFQSTLQIEHESKSDHRVAPDRLVTAAVDSITKEAVTQLSAIRSKHYEDYGPSPRFPDSFVPEYEPPEDYRFLEQFDAQQLLAGPRFMRSTWAAWEIETDVSLDELFATIREELAADNYRGARHESKNRPHYLRAVHPTSSLTVEVFPVEKRHEPTSADATAPSTTRIHVLVHRLLPTSIVQDALTAAREHKLSPRVVLALVGYWPNDARPHLLEYVQENLPRSAEEWLRFDQIFARQLSEEQRHRSLLTAYYLSRTSRNPRVATSTIRDAAEDLGMPPLEEIIDDDLLAQLDCRNLTEISDKDRFRITPETPLRLYQPDEEGIEFTAIHLVNDQASDDIQLHVIRSAKNFRSSSSMSASSIGTHVHQLGPGLRLELRQSDEDDALEGRVMRSAPKAPTKDDRKKPMKSA